MTIGFKDIEFFDEPMSFQSPEEVGEMCEAVSQSFLLQQQGVAAFDVFRKWDIYKIMDKFISIRAPFGMCLIARNVASDFFKKCGQDQTQITNLRFAYCNTHEFSKFVSLANKFGVELKGVDGIKAIRILGSAFAGGWNSDMLQKLARRLVKREGEKFKVGFMGEKDLFGSVFTKTVFYNGIDGSVIPFADDRVPTSYSVNMMNWRLIIDMPPHVLETFMVHERIHGYIRNKLWQRFKQAHKDAGKDAIPTAEFIKWKEGEFLRLVVEEEQKNPPEMGELLLLVGLSESDAASDLTLTYDSLNTEADITMHYVLEEAMVFGVQMRMDNVATTEVLRNFNKEDVEEYVQMGMHFLPRKVACLVTCSEMAESDNSDRVFAQFKIHISELMSEGMVLEARKQVLEYLRWKKAFMAANGALLSDMGEVSDYLY